MEINPWLDRVPLWGIYLATVGLFLLAVEAGFRLGVYRHRAGEEEKRSQAGSIMSATLGLLAFLLAFTFAAAAARFAERINLVIDESNAIGTAYLRSTLLPDADTKVSRDLMRQYVDLRLKAAALDDPQKMQQILVRSEEIHTQLWSEATALVKKNSNPAIASLYVQSLNEVIDLHAKRVATAIRNRLAPSIWLTLYFVGFIAMVVMGYHAGLTDVRSTIATFALVLSLSVVMLLIIDLDRLYQTFFSVTQQAMIDLQNTMNRVGEAGK